MRKHYDEYLDYLEACADARDYLGGYTVPEGEEISNKVLRHNEERAKQFEAKYGRWLESGAAAVWGYQDAPLPGPPVAPLIDMGEPTEQPDGSTGAITPAIPAIKPAGSSGDKEQLKGSLAVVPVTPTAKPTGSSEASNAVASSVGSDGHDAKTEKKQGKSLKDSIWAGVAGSDPDAKWKDNTR